MAQTQPSGLSTHAMSLDGRTFHFQGPADTPWAPGDLVVLRTESDPLICAQVLAKRVSTEGHCEGSGSILGKVSSGGRIAFGRVGSFARAEVEPTPPEMVSDLQVQQDAQMLVGAAGAGEAKLRSKGFNRHTFMCGQSGSGKSYALGLLIEQLLIDTDIPMIILDPNADFVTLDNTLSSAAPADKERLDNAGIKVLRPDPGPEHGELLVRFTTLSLEARAAVMQLDPLKDRAEYNLLVHLNERMSATEADQAAAVLMASPDPDERALGQRIENLGILGWSVWAAGREAVLDNLRPFPRATVLDLSGFESPRERLVTAVALLDDLWAHREERQPVLLVIDEAHNVCTNAPQDPLEEAAAARLIQIASEGRKYGIWLLLCTQRPSRIHESVLSQCDNLALMRMNSRGDLSQLERVFGFAPPEMLAAAPYFRQGECLMAGAFIPTPTFVQVGQRRTRQGGSDVSVPLPAPAP